MTRKPLAALGLTAAAAVGGSFFVSGVASAASTPAGAPAARISAAAPAASHLWSLTNSPTPAAAPTAPAAAPAAAPVAAAASSYTVVSGDSLWAISQRFGVSLTTLASANGMNLHDILPVGKVLTIPTGGAATSTSASSDDSDSSSASSSSEAAETSDDSDSSSSTSSHQSSSSSAAPSSSFESCVINSESGGDPDVTNSSGHYGLYQFSKSTWEEYGGSASSFGDASAAEQHEVFSRAVADGGSSNWSAYDGC